MDQVLKQPAPIDNYVPAETGRGRLGSASHDIGAVQDPRTAILL